MESWNDFSVAQVGGSAALAGLLFVAISINLDKVLAAPELTDRAGVPLILLLGILVISSLILVPGQPVGILGIELLVCGIIIWGVVTALDIKRLRKTKHPSGGAEPPRILLTQLASLPYIIAGIVLLTVGENGMYWLVPAVVASFLKAFSDAWVLLVEINR